jgi:hypothetical protein
MQARVGLGVHTKLARHSPVVFLCDLCGCFVTFPVYKLQTAGRTRRFVCLEAFVHIHIRDHQPELGLRHIALLA